MGWPEKVQPPSLRVRIVPPSWISVSGLLTTPMQATALSARPVPQADRWAIETGFSITS